MVENDLIEELISLAGKSIGPPTVMERIHSCDTYRVEDYEKLCRQAMNRDDMRIFLAHCRKCLPCLKGILEQWENEVFFQKTLGLMDTLEKEAGENIFEIVVKVSRKVCELISTTGQILGGVSPAPARGGGAAENKKEPIQIIKEFDDPPISVQASFETHRKSEGVAIRLSLFNKRRDAFMGGCKATLSGAEKEQTRETDENGEAVFLMPGPGKYRVDMVEGEDKIACLNITMN